MISLTQSIRDNEETAWLAYDHESDREIAYNLTEKEMIKFLFEYGLNDRQIDGIFASSDTVINGELQ